MSFVKGELNLIQVIKVWLAIGFAAWFIVKVNIIIDILTMIYLEVAGN